MGNIIKNIKIKVHRTIILPFVLYGCATLWFTLTDECRLRVFENTVLRRIFGPKRDKVTGDWRKVHKTTEPDDLYSLPNIILVIKARRMIWVAHVAHMRERRDAYRVLVGKPEGKRALGRPREDNIKIDLQAVGWGTWTGFSWLKIGTGCGHLHL